METTAHADLRINQRNLDRKVIATAMKTMESILSGKELKFTFDNITIVAKKENNVPVVITAWPK